MNRGPAGRLGDPTKALSDAKAASGEPPIAPAGRLGGAARGSIDATAASSGEPPTAPDGALMKTPGGASRELPARMPGRTPPPTPPVGRGGGAPAARGPRGAKVRSVRNLSERGRRTRAAREWVIEKFLFLNGAAAVIIIALIFLFLFREGLQALGTIPLSSFWGSAETDWDGNATYVHTWQPNGDNPVLAPSAPVRLAPRLGSRCPDLGAIGLATGVFLAEIASIRVRNLVKPVIELLAGIPTIVIGFFCLATLASFLQDLLHTEFRLNAMVGAIGVSFVIIPVIASLVDDALRAVPAYLREAAYGMGATRWETVSQVVLPAAVSGVTAALILGMGRALGETMIVLLATGNAAQVTLNPFVSVRTMTATIAAELGAVPQGGPWYQSLFLVGAVPSRSPSPSTRRRIGRRSHAEEAHPQTVRAG
jgi:phosphate transport system permease protein